MSDEPLLTLKQLAQELHLPESTARYYRDAFLDHIPSVGTGRRRRYPREAIAVLRSIADDYAAGRPRREIEAGMNGRGTASPAYARPAEQPSRAMPLDDVTNLDLLAAILDGEREQRDALWQMAKEIVRLTDVLEGQDKVLTEIAGHAGVTNLPPLARPVASLAAPPRAEAPARQEHVLKDGPSGPVFAERRLQSAGPASRGNDMHQLK
ncbi:MAG: MerR family transcriptional regulator, partial [Gemmatimonadales bacterium]